MATTNCEQVPRPIFYWLCDDFRQPCTSTKQVLVQGRKCGERWHLTAVSRRESQRIRSDGKSAQGKNTGDTKGKRGGTRKSDSRGEKGTTASATSLCCGTKGHEKDDSSRKMVTCKNCGKIGRLPASCHSSLAHEVNGLSNEVAVEDDWCEASRRTTDTREIWTCLVRFAMRHVCQGAWNVQTRGVLCQKRPHFDGATVKDRKQGS